MFCAAYRDFCRRNYSDVWLPDATNNLRFSCRVTANSRSTLESLSHLNKRFQIIVSTIGLVLLSACSNSRVHVDPVQLYEGPARDVTTIAALIGTYGVLGGGVATAICKVDGAVFEPCRLYVEVLPGAHVVEVREILGNAEIYRTYEMEFEAGEAYSVDIHLIPDHYEEPVIRSRGPIIDRYCVPHC